MSQVPRILPYVARFIWNNKGRHLDILYWDVLILKARGARL